MIDRTEILTRNPIVPFLEARDVVLKGTGNKLTSNRCAVAEHKLSHQCVNVDAERGIWYCNDCGEGGSVIDWMMKEQGIDAKAALEQLGGGYTPPAQKLTSGHSGANNTAKAKMIKAYDYTDETGNLLFQVCRFEPKDFRQRAPDGKGGWIYKLDGVRRVLYNLPRVLAADFLFICEGEKDADALNALGMVATTSCGGAKKWDPSYTAALRGKSVCLLPDNDKAGSEHRDALRAALAPVVKEMRIVEMPQGTKDVSEFFATFPTSKDGARELISMLERADTLFKGESVPVQTMGELEAEYREHVQKAATHQLNLSAWLPGFANIVRPLVPGELCTILAGTGCGKTMMLQNIAINTNLHTLLFEAELPGTLTFERFAAMSVKRTGRHVEDTYKLNGTVDWKGSGKLNHVVCCHKSSLTPAKIQRIIETAELKTSMRPVLVLIDYIQLIGGDGESRYERTSGVAEQLKIVAKETGTIIVMASQIGRASNPKDGKKKETREVTLTDGKDSGSIENSSGLVLGAWRDDNDPDRLFMRVLKNTKGISGRTIPCRILESLIIREEAPEQ